MSTEPGERAAAPEIDSNLSRTYVLVVFVEILVIAGLYWLGRHFS